MDDCSFFIIWLYSSVGRAKETNPYDVGSIPTGATHLLFKSDERKWLIWKVILIVILIVIFLD